MQHSNRRAIADIVTRLLSHFATADEPLAVRQAMAQDWVDDLEEFALADIEAATKEWRQTFATRPTIAEIRKLAIANQRRESDRRALEDKSREQEGGSWEPWLYEIWGPASTGRIARQQALDDWNRRLARGEAYREGRLAEFDAGLGRQTPAGSGKNFRFTDKEIRKRLEYARLKGYETWGDFQIAHEAGKESMLPFVDWAAARRPGPKLQPVKGFRSLGEVLGNMGVSSTPSVPVTWMEPDAEGKLLPRASAYSEPHARRAPNSSLASYPEDPT